MMAPPNLTAYLVELADLIGYDLDLDELEPVTGIHPLMVIEWATAGTDHACLAYIRGLLAGPIGFLQQHTDRTGSAEVSDLDLSLLAELREQDQRLCEALDAASRRYAAACQALLHTGLIWSRVADEHTKSRPTGSSAGDPQPADTATTPRPPLGTAEHPVTESTGAEVTTRTEAARINPPDRDANTYWTPWGGWANSIEDALGIPPE
jgi:hypothetical protein